MIVTSNEFKQDKQEVSTVAKHRIMIVDDNVELLEELDNLLTLGGYDVIALSDGSMVFDVALNNKPDLILLDLKMSPKSGFQIADEVKNSIYLKNVPVVAMTGFFTEKTAFIDDETMWHQDIYPKAF